MRNKIIYVIDDDPVFKLIAKKLLEKQGKFSSIVFFENGLDGLNSLKDELNNGAQHKPDVIFLDIEMPLMNGWGFMDEFVKLPDEQKKGIDIYIVSSSIADDDKNKATSYKEIKEYITKPLTPEDLNKIAAL